jgi:hypothetical protein
MGSFALLLGVGCSQPVNDVASLHQSSPPTHEASESLEEVAQATVECLRGFSVDAVTVNGTAIAIESTLPSLLGNADGYALNTGGVTDPAQQERDSARLLERAAEYEIAEGTDHPVVLLIGAGDYTSEWRECLTRFGYQGGPAATDPTQTLLRMRRDADATVAWVDCMRARSVEVKDPAAPTSADQPWPVALVSPSTDPTVFATALAACPLREPLLVTESDIGDVLIEGRYYPNAAIDAPGFDQSGDSVPDGLPEDQIQRLGELQGLLDQSRTQDTEVFPDGEDSSTDNA